MDLGFDTIGNATVIAHDKVPIIATDPWLGDPAYFGSWTLSHTIPTEQYEDILKCPYVWLSHGHPDHINGQSISYFAGKQLIVPNHVGGRIATDLRQLGHMVHVLEDRTWLQLSPRIRVMNLCNYNQDAILLIDIGGRLIVNMNDAQPLGWDRTVRSIAKNYTVSFLLKLSGYGDADMINYRDAEGRLIAPAAAVKSPIGPRIGDWLKQWGIRFFIPFSAFHRYQRSDSIWANSYTTPAEAHAEGFNCPGHCILPAFLRYNCMQDVWDLINPPEMPKKVLPPEYFGDNWADMLEADDVPRLRAYIGAITHLATFLDYIVFKVGGKETALPLARKHFHRGIVFEVPRHSLMSAAQYEIFDDLLIGNFMKTTLVGRWSSSRLYPDFTPYVSKYADNGRAKTKEELRQYFKSYEQRALDIWLFHLDFRAKNAFRHWAGEDSQTVRLTTQAYRALKRMSWR